MALLQESSKQVEESMESSKESSESSEEVVEINSMSTSKEVESESSESKISISEQLWKNCESEALYFWYSPLFVHMASGTLDDKEFYEYVANYTHLLNNFLEVYKLAADQCEDDSDKAAFSGWSNNVKQELERHSSIVENKLGFDPTRETTLHTATAKYKEFLLATASGDIQVHEIPIHQSKIPAYTLGAMTPSLRLYAFLSKAVRELVASDDTSQPRSKWIKEYSYESFKTSYLHAEVLLDKLCNCLAQEEIGVVERLYRQAMRLKMDFFYSRQSEQTLVIPVYTKLDPTERLILFADFDFTCTDLGSLGILENIAIMTAQKADQLLQVQDRDKPSHISTTDLKNTWELLSQQSTSEYDNCIKKIILSEKALSFNYHGLHSALVELSSSEEQAVSRIFDSGVLKGISLEDIKQLFLQKRSVNCASQGCSSSSDGGGEKQVKKVTSDLEPFLKCSRCNRNLIARNLTTYFNARFLRIVSLRGRGIIGGAVAAPNPDFAEFDLHCRFCRRIVGYGFVRPLHQQDGYFLKRARVY